MEKGGRPPARNSDRGALPSGFRVISADTLPPDAGLLDWLGLWIPEESLRRTILVDNPGRLYDFRPFPFLA
jgi:hypothetical protein